MSAKKMVLVLGGLVGVFAFATGWGQMSDGDSVGPVATSVMQMLTEVKLSSRLGSPDVKPLKRSDVRSDCFGQLRSVTLDEGESCTLQVRKPSNGAPVRALELQLEQGNEVKVKTENGSQTLYGESKKRKLTVQFARAGELTIEAIDCDSQCEIAVP